MENNDAVRRIQAAYQLAKADAQYTGMMVEYRNLEQQFEELAKKLSPEEQDIAWGFICHSENMNVRMLEILCEKFGILRNEKEGE